MMHTEALILSSVWYFNFPPAECFLVSYHLSADFSLPFIARKQATLSKRSVWILNIFHGICCLKSNFVPYSIDIAVLQRLKDSMKTVDIFFPFAVNIMELLSLEDFSLSLRIEKWEHSQTHMKEYTGEELLVFLYNFWRNEKW